MLQFSEILESDFVELDLLRIMYGIGGVGKDFISLWKVNEETSWKFHI